MKIKKKCPECRQPVVVPGNAFVEVSCPSCNTVLYVDYGTFTEAGRSSRFSPDLFLSRDAYPHSREEVPVEFYPSE